ncbi:rRNA maturation RNase YbeY [Pseudalkalibacillus hwajinpoensis]|uniref:rRNA maturation RNase YbeY n=1 Tax=Guptibacillus hwajinpoensis TaxID=208199 RepID=UPI001CD5FB19|nr:rRNA maturation RNase YbeY [Pseudalkalibacillus hwajinpoensis]MCA0992896.1 rRNA maturation RNase YbeY [Pseudalkalibacillus hwajinpoensis]
MNLTIDFIDETETLNQDQLEMLEKLLSHAAKEEGVEAGSEVSIMFVNNERITEINRDYRGKDQPTDVISFALDDEEEGDDPIVFEEQIPHLLGEIVVSVPKIKEQATDYGHSFERELGFLCVHGFLHLLGYDHMTDEDEKEMFGKQKVLLEQYGLTR